MRCGRSLPDTPGAAGKGKAELIQEAEESRAFMIRNQENERVRQEQVLRCPPIPRTRHPFLPCVRAFKLARGSGCRARGACRASSLLRALDVVWSSGT